MTTRTVAVRMLGAMVVVAGTGLAAGCASSAGDGQGGRPEATDPDLITRAQIERSQWTDVYDLVRNLRPRWLQRRGADSFANPGEVQVYVDGTRLGGIDLLRGMPTSAIDRLEWVDPVDAAGRWGLDHAHGVIAIFYGRRE